MKRTVIKAISLCLIIFLILCLKNEYAWYLMKNYNYGMPALIERGEIDNLYIGSSMFRQALSIDELDKENDETHYILAYNGNQPCMEYIELEYMLNKNIKIKRLYVDMYAYTMVSTPQISDEKIFLEIDVSTKRAIEEVVENMSASDKWSMWFTSNNEQLLTMPITGTIVNRTFKNGGTLVENPGMDTEAYGKLYPPMNEDKLNDCQINAIKKIINLCSDNNIELIFLDTPKSYAVYSSDKYRKIMKEYSAILDEYNVKHIVQDIDYDFDIGNSKLFMDAVHLSSEGRKVFTKELINEHLH